MEALLRELWQLREIQELAQLMESGGGPALVTGLSPVHRAMTAAALRLKSGRPLLMLCADEGEARRQAADLRSLTGREPVLLTGRELHWRELAAVSRQWEYRRLEALYRIRQEESPVIVTTADALALRCIPPQVLDRCSFTLRSDGRYQVEELARRLGKSQSAIANKLRLLRLPQEVLTLLRKNGFTERHARALLRLPTPEAQKEGAELLVKEGWTVSRTERYVEEVLRDQAKEKKVRRPLFIRDVRFFLNTLDHSLTVMRSAGVDAKCQRVEEGDDILLTIRIPKAKAPSGPA